MKQELNGFCDSKTGKFINWHIGPIKDTGKG